MGRRTQSKTTERKINPMSDVQQERSPRGDELADVTEQREAWKRNALQAEALISEIRYAYQRGDDLADLLSGIPDSSEVLRENNANVLEEAGEAFVASAKGRLTKASVQEWLDEQARLLREGEDARTE
jgi:hypothetical protein